MPGTDFHWSMFCSWLAYSMNMASVIWVCSSFSSRGHFDREHGRDIMGIYGHMMIHIE